MMNFSKLSVYEEEEFYSFIFKSFDLSSKNTMPGKSCIILIQSTKIPFEFTLFFYNFTLH